MKTNGEKKLIKKILNITRIFGSKKSSKKMEKIGKKTRTKVDIPELEQRYRRRYDKWVWEGIK